MEIKKIILELLFPRRCPFCHEPVMPKGGLSCVRYIGKTLVRCAEHFSYVTGPVCFCCGKGLAKETDEFCAGCAERTGNFSNGMMLLNYDDAAKKSIAIFKYGGRPEYAKFYASELAKRHGQRVLRLNVQAIVPVPLHESRLRRRGYNQAAVLAMELGKLLNLPVLDGLLVRTQKTVAQKNLHAEERAANLRHAISAAYAPKGLKRVIVADDIYTTGATMTACAAALRNIGVEEIYPMCVAIV